MGLLDLFRRKRPEGPQGVAVRVHAASAGPGAAARPARRASPWLWAGVLAAAALYLGAHYSVVTGVWPVHGTSPGATRTLMRDAGALVAWLLVLGTLRGLGYRGSWAIVALPVMVFFLSRPAQFQVFTDPVYQAAGSSRAQANELKADRSRISTIERTYPPERQEEVFGGPPPPLPDPWAQAVRGVAEGETAFLRGMSHYSVFLAPLALLLGYLLSRRAERLRWFRHNRTVPYLVTLGAFFVLTLFFTELGKVGGTTPWELFLPVFIATWAAVLADDAYNLARPGEVLAPQRLLGLVLYGLLPVVPFLVIRELGLSIVLAGSLAAMLLVGTRRGWWAGLMLVAWAALVFAAFNVDERSRTRLELAYDPYRDPAQMTEPEVEAWAAKLHQMKLFDANVLAGGVFGEGPGRGHGETAPNSADDGYITLHAAQWGLVGGVALVLLYTVFLICMFMAAVRERGAFERTLVTGLAMLIAIPFWLATLGGIRVIPLTGVAAAFAAHGGAKLLASALAVGIIAGISHRRTEEEQLENALAPPREAAEVKGVRIR
ncbi:MAG TPA: FtsW/RodA/SpoVE family cell cycle protein [Longimicrobiaceae bacterium]|nr:FtsW/RodA/SpoVE family cell cycle protein [Longimicrobiaceae bacterium]